MGLDISLYKTRKLYKEDTPEIIKMINDYIFYQTDKEYEGQTFEDFSSGGHSIEEVDIKKVEKYKLLSNNDPWGMLLFEEIYDGGKANHIHNWMVDNIQGGKDDYGYYELTKEKGEEFIKIANKVIEESELDDFDIIDPTTAKKLLPRKEGYWFGSQEYNYFYLASINDVKVILEETLENLEEDEMIVYNASW